MSNKWYLFLLMLLCSIALHAGVFSLVPQPSSVQSGDGEFIFGKKLGVSVPTYEGDSLEAVIDRFSKGFEQSTGIKLKKGKKAQMNIVLNSKLPTEGYKLEIDKKEINIEVAAPAGLFYALQTLKQLMPRNVMAEVSDATTRRWSLPAVAISDSPRFGWRGFMLDEGRHFYGKEEIKKII